MYVIGFPYIPVLHQATLPNGMGPQPPHRQGVGDLHYFCTSISTLSLSLYTYIYVCVYVYVHKYVSVIIVMPV